MQRGKLGVVVVMVAIVGALAASWVLSMDVAENEVTKYNMLADITSEYDTKQTPQYIRYDPSTNYTGYYTDDSTVAEIRYFDGVEFTSSSPNNYRLNLKPLVDESASVDLSTLTRTGLIDPVHYWATADRQTTIQDVRYITLEQFISQTALSGDEIKIISDQGSFTTGQFFSFIKDSDRRSNLFMKNPTLTGTLKLYPDGYPGGTVDVRATDALNPILACTYNTGSQQAIMYYDSAMTAQAGIWSPSEVLIIWEDNGFLGHTGQTNLLDLQDPQYMDISQGVSL